MIRRRRQLSSRFTFIDLFAGIGGTRLGFESVGGDCVFSSEWDARAQHTYAANFGEVPAGDITAIDPASVPDHDVLVAGFPCQPFSIAGVSKKKSLGRPHGFLDRSQGTLFFSLAQILEEKRPRCFLLENVKNILHHDRGWTYKVIKGTLERDLGYTVFETVIDSSVVVPQRRKRVYIVGFDGAAAFRWPRFRDRNQRLRDILEEHVPAKYTLTDHLWCYLQEYARKHRARGNGFGYGLADLGGVTRTLSARYYKDGSEILVPQRGKSPRRLTPRECARLMGFPDSFRIPVADTCAYKQFGNSVVVPVVAGIARSISRSLGLEPLRRRFEPSAAEQLELFAAS